MNEAKVAKIVNALYQSRKLKLTDPEGYIDARGRWFPSPREDAGDGKTVSMPTTKNRYSFKVHCRSKHHVRILVGRALQGLDVPPDVRSMVFPDKEAGHNPDDERIIPGVMKGDIPQLMEEFMTFLAHRSANPSLNKHGRA